MSLYDLANRFYKLAVELTIVNEQEIKRIFQELVERTQEVYDYVTGAVQLNSMIPESKNHADRLRVLTMGALNMIIQPEVDINALTQKTQQIIGEFETFKNNYLPQAWIDANNYEPMRKIQDGLAAVERLLQQQQNQPTGQSETVSLLT